jgi:hypothetical protein
MIYDQGNVLFIGDIVDTTGYKGYYLGRLNSAGQLTCLNHFIDSSRVKQLVFSPSLKIADHRYAAMGFAWKKSRPMLVIFNEECDTIFTREYVVLPYDSLYYQIMQDIIPIPGIGFAIIGQVGAYQSLDSLRAQGFVLMLNEGFEVMWQKQFGAEHSDYAICGDFLPPDTILLFGIEQIGAYTWPVTPWSRYLRVMKISLTDGTLIWEKKDIPPDRSTIFDCVRTPDNGYILCAAEMVDSFYANGLPGNYYPRNSVFHLNSNFDVTWEVTYGQKSISKYSFNSDMVGSIENDGVVVVGTAWDFLDTVGFMTVVSKISWSGDSIWTRYFMPVHNNPEIDYFSSSSAFDQILATENGYMLQTDVILDTLATEYPYKEQIWFLELDRHGCHIPGCHLSTSSKDQIPEVLPDSIQISIFPNPVSDILSVQLKGLLPNDSRLALYDAAGRLLMSSLVSHPDTQFLFPTRNLPSGSYSIVLLQDGMPVAAKSLLKI